MMRYKLIVIEGGYLIPVDEETGNEILIPDVVAAEEILNEKVC